MRTTRHRSLFRAPLVGLSAVGALVSGMAVHAGTPTSADGDIRQAILDCTFEVLAEIGGNASAGATGTAGAAGTQLTTQSRVQDGAAPQVRVAGSAFCFANGELATAAHVFDQLLGSRFAAPIVRDRHGRTFAVDRILRYSMRDDFVVFSVSGMADRRPPEIAARPHATFAGTPGDMLHLAWRRADRDIAFGNTRYRGRSTLEELGREGWIQFGPAPGHGASGAAVFDTAGHIVGMVNSRSSERPDAHAYAVPIQVVEAASTEWADIASRDPLRTLGMASERNMPLIGGIPLPSPYARFEQHMIEVRKTYFAHMLPYSLSLAGGGAPMTDGQRESLCTLLGPGYCEAGEAFQSTPARERNRSRGCQVEWSGVGASLVRCATPSNLTPAKTAAPEPEQLQMASMGRRASQPAPAPCTNRDPLESLAASEKFADHTGAEWQIRAWPVRGCDWIVVSMSRLTADGLIGLVRGAPSAYADAAAMQLKALTSIRCEGCGKDSRDAVIAQADSARSEPSRERTR